VNLQDFRIWAVVAGGVLVLFVVFAILAGISPRTTTALEVGWTFTVRLLAGLVVLAGLAVVFLAVLNGGTVPDTLPGLGLVLAGTAVLQPHWGIAIAFGAFLSVVAFRCFPVKSPAPPKTRTKKV
jgi:hypothetical protein